MEIYCEFVIFLLSDRALDKTAFDRRNKRNATIAIEFIFDLIAPLKNNSTNN